MRYGASAFGFVGRSSRDEIFARQLNIFCLDNFQAKDNLSRLTTFVAAGTASMARPRIGDERREQILEAFEACVLRNGIEKTTLEDIAKEAGQPRPLVRYFAGNRDDLTSLLIDRMVQRVAERLAAIHALGAGSTTKFVQAFVSAFYGDELSNRTTVELWSMSIRSPALTARLFTLYDDILQVFAEEVAAAQPDLNAEEAFDATYATYSLLLGAAILTGLGLTPYKQESVLRTAEGLASGTFAKPTKTKRTAIRRKASRSRNHDCS